MFVVVWVDGKRLRLKISAATVASQQLSTSGVQWLSSYTFHGRNTFIITEPFTSRK